MRFRFSLPVRLALLVAGTTLPLILFTAGYIFFDYRSDKIETYETVNRLTRGIRLVLDREMTGIVSGLTVLASSRSLANDDFDNFRIGANAFLDRFPGGQASIVVGGRDGRQVFNSALPKGAELPPRTSRPERDQVFKTGKPAFSPLFFGSVSKRPIITVIVPVMRNGEVVYDLSFDPPIELFQHIIEQQKPSDDWTLSIFDQTGVNIARVPNPETTFGKMASPTLLPLLASQPEGQGNSVSLEGVPLLTGWSRSELTGWSVGAGIAERTLTAPLVQSVVLATSIGAIMLAIGLGFAIRMATQIARAETLHELLINELNHRVKNTLATVQSMAGQTFRGSADEEARGKFSGRLVALGRSHDLLSEEKWAGANLFEVVEGVLSPFQSGGRIEIGGSAVRLSARSVVMLALALNELATNATKYGALSTPDGKVAVTWQQTTNEGEPWLIMRWQESNGPPVHQPKRNGFGSTLVGQGLPAQLGGRASLNFAPDGLVCVIECPVR
ncbi:MAG: sensor histidine kinase [Pseudolabrys sp.]|nr:sensor histidine kinase [Pseudolabrys sp.]